MINLIDAVARSENILQLMKHSLGMINLLIECSDRSQEDGGDYAHEMLHIINSSNPLLIKKIFYPELHSVDAKLTVQSMRHPLKLKVMRCQMHCCILYYAGFAALLNICIAASYKLRLRIITHFPLFVSFPVRLRHRQHCWHQHTTRLRRPHAVS